MKTGRNPTKRLRNRAIEEDFQTLFSTVSLVYSARQNAKLKRRWPLSKMVIVAPEKVRKALKNVEDLLLELTNVKTVEYAEKAPQHVAEEGWTSASENDTQVFLDVHRDQKLLGEGLMRDLARRVQALRKELGYMPTDVLDAVHIAELDQETIQLLQPYLQEMKELTRTKNIHLRIKPRRNRNRMARVTIRRKESLHCNPMRKAASSRHDKRKLLTFKPRGLSHGQVGNCCPDMARRASGCRCEVVFSEPRLHTIRTEACNVTAWEHVF